MNKITCQHGPCTEEPYYEMHGRPYCYGHLMGALDFVTVCCLGSPGPDGWPSDDMVNEVTFTIRRLRTLRLVTDDAAG